MSVFLGETTYIVAIYTMSDRKMTPIITMVLSKVNKDSRAIQK